jgi:hypothetical protein
MSPVKSPVDVACLDCPQVPLVYTHAGDWCTPVPYETYIIAVVDVPNIPTGHHQAPSPEPPHGQLPQTIAVCILVHVVSLHAPLEALHQYLLYSACQHHYWEEVWPRLDHAPCRRPRQGDQGSLRSLHHLTHPICLA